MSLSGRPQHTSAHTHENKPPTDIDTRIHIASSTQKELHYRCMAVHHRVVKRGQPMLRQTPTINGKKKKSVGAELPSLDSNKTAATGSPRKAQPLGKEGYKRSDGAAEHSQWSRPPYWLLCLKGAQQPTSSRPALRSGEESTETEHNTIPSRQAYQSLPRHERIPSPRAGCCLLDPHPPDWRQTREGDTT